MKSRIQADGHLSLHYHHLAHKATVYHVSQATWLHHMKMVMKSQIQADWRLSLHYYFSPQGYRVPCLTGYVAT